MAGRWGSAYCPWMEARPAFKFVSAWLMAIMPVVMPLHPASDPVGGQLVLCASIGLFSAFAPVPYLLMWVRSELMLVVWGWAMLVAVTAIRECVIAGFWPWCDVEWRSGLSTAISGSALWLASCGVTVAVDRVLGREDLGHGE